MHKHRFYQPQPSLSLTLLSNNDSHPWVWQVWHQATFSSKCIRCSSSLPPPPLPPSASPLSIGDDDDARSNFPVISLDYTEMTAFIDRTRVYAKIVRFLHKGK